MLNLQGFTVVMVLLKQLHGSRLSQQQWMKNKWSAVNIVSDPIVTILANDHNHHRFCGQFVLVPPLCSQRWMLCLNQVIWNIKHHRNKQWNRGFSFVVRNFLRTLHHRQWTRLYQMTGKSCKFVYSSCHCVKNVVKSKLQIVPRLGVTVHTNSDHDVCVDWDWYHNFDIFSHIFILRGEMTASLMRNQFVSCFIIKHVWNCNVWHI